MKTGNTLDRHTGDLVWVTPQWSPVMKTGNTSSRRTRALGCIVPQWSPVMKTGNTTFSIFGSKELKWASMEPGHEDREYDHSEE